MAKSPVNSPADQFTYLQAAPTITWFNPADTTYGTALGATQLDATADVAGTFAYTPATGTMLHAGNNQTLSVTFTPTDATDYTTATKSVSISVGQAPLTITPENQTKVVRGLLPTLTYTVTGLVGSDTLTTPPVLFTSATGASHVGSYAITTSGAAASTDYTIGYVGGTLTVTPVSLTIAADGKIKVYGASLPLLTASYTGFVDGDTAASLTTKPTITSAATATSHTGTYGIVASGAVDPDYVMNYLGGTLSVFPATVTVMADTKTKTYGAALPTLTYTVMGLIGSDTLITPPTLSTSATAASHVGTYSIAPRRAAVSSDYAISYQGGMLFVTPATLTITADNKSKICGAALPALTVSYAGLVNGDTVASLITRPTVTTIATATSLVGAYPITAANAAAADYRIVYVNGVLTITRGATTTTLVASPNPSVVGQTVTFTATVRANPPGAVTPSGTRSASGMERRSWPPHR